MGCVGQNGDHVEVEGGTEVALRGVKEGGSKPEEGVGPNQGVGRLLREAEGVPEEAIERGEIKIQNQIWRSGLPTLTLFDLSQF